MMEMAGKSVVKKQIPFIFISNRFRTKRSLHECGGMTGRVMSGCMSFQVLVGNAWLKYSGWGSQAR